MSPGISSRSFQISSVNSFADQIRFRDDFIQFAI